MKIIPSRAELRDPEYLAEYLGTAFLYIFMFLMTFNLVLAGLNYENYRYVIKEPFETVIKPADCGRPDLTVKKEYITTVNESSLVFREPISQSPEYWEERCKYKEITQEEYEELQDHYNRIFWLSFIGLTGLTISSPRARKNIKKIYKHMKESEELE